MASTQALEHLRMANHAKSARSRVKREIREGKRTAASVIANPPNRCGRMPLIDVLRAQHRWGAQRARVFCRDVQIHELRTLERLTDAQRRRIIDTLRLRA